MRVALSAPVSASSACPGGSSSSSLTFVATSGALAHSHRGGAFGCAYDIGWVSAEPTIGIDRRDRIYYYPADVDGAGPRLAVSSDRGRHWSLAEPSSVVTQSADSYLALDVRTGRAYVSDLQLGACTRLAWTDDRRTWTTTPLACGTPVNDMQSLILGPAPANAAAPSGYRNVVYLCYHDVAVVGPWCSHSLDGGKTFLPGGPPSAEVITGCGEGVLTHGGQVLADGTLALPGICEVADAGGDSTPVIVLSHDEGMTWTLVKPTGQVSSQLPALAVDARGTLYAGWIRDIDRQPVVSLSTDAGRHWRAPIRVGVPGLRQANLIALAAGGPGSLAISYLGSADAPGGPFNAVTELKDSVGAQSGYASATWHGYLSATTTMLSERPVVTSAAIDPSGRPLLTGACGPGRCGAVYDFISTAVGPDGTVYGTYVDGSTAHGLLARLDGVRVRPSALPR